MIDTFGAVVFLFFGVLWCFMVVVFNNVWVSGVFVCVVNSFVVAFVAVCVCLFLFGFQYGRLLLLCFLCVSCLFVFSGRGLVFCTGVVGVVFDMGYLFLLSWFSL